MARRGAEWRGAARCLCRNPESLAELLPRVAQGRFNGGIRASRFSRKEHAAYAAATRLARRKQKHFTAARARARALRVSRSGERRSCAVAPWTCTYLPAYVRIPDGSRYFIIYMWITVRTHTYVLHGWATCRENFRLRLQQCARCR